MRRDTDVVKTPPAAAQNGPLRAAFHRHLQGYELGLVTLGMVLTCALLALPRASVPDTLPLPRVDHVEARRSAAREQALAALAEAEGLPFEVRAVGESIRHYGRSVTQSTDTSHDRGDIRERFKVAIARGQAPLLLRLRAVQTQYFLSALDKFEHDRTPNTDLQELGADFVANAKANGWFEASGRCVADEATRRVLFRMHWADLVEQRAAFPYAPTLDEWRIYYHFLLLHPTLRSSESSFDAERLRVVAALSRKDPEYPGFFAKGYLLYQLDDRESAASAFRAQLAQHPSGPYSLLARNYLIHSLQGVSVE